MRHLQHRPFAKEDARVFEGEYIIPSGQLVYIAKIGEPERRTKTERPDSRLRVIYDNGTESDIPMRSLQRARYVDKALLTFVGPSGCGYLNQHNNTV